MLGHISPYLKIGLWLIALLLLVYFVIPSKKWGVPIVVLVLAVSALAFQPLVELVTPQKFITDTSTLPTFIDASQEVIFSLGEGGVHHVYPWEDFQNKIADPFRQEQIPFYAYVYNGKICVDVSIYGNKENPLVQIKQNKLIVFPQDWDRNHDKNAFEVVNEKQEPIFQLIYQTPFHLIVNGIFPVSNGLLYASESGLAQSPIPKTDFRLRRIFKYPSKENMGIRKD